MIFADITSSFRVPTQQPHSIVQRRLLEGNIPRLRGEARDTPPHVRSPLADSKEGGEPEERSESTVDDSTEERESPEESEKSLRSDEDEDNEEERKKVGERASNLSALVVQCKVIHKPLDMVPFKWFFAVCPHNGGDEKRFLSPDDSEIVFAVDSSSQQIYLFITNAHICIITKDSSMILNSFIIFHNFSRHGSNDLNFLMFPGFFNTCENHKYSQHFPITKLSKLTLCFTVEQIERHSASSLAITPAE